MAAMFGHDPAPIIRPVQDQRPIDAPRVATAGGRSLYAAGLTPMTLPARPGLVATSRVSERAATVEIPPGLVIKVCPSPWDADDAARVAVPAQAAPGSFLEAHRKAVRKARRADAAKGPLQLSDGKSGGRDGA